MDEEFDDINMAEASSIVYNSQFKLLDSWNEFENNLKDIESQSINQILNIDFNIPFDDYYKTVPKIEIPKSLLTVNSDFVRGNYERLLSWSEQMLLNLKRYNVRIAGNVSKLENVLRISEQTLLEVGPSLFTMLDVLRLRRDEAENELNNIQQQIQNLNSQLFVLNKSVDAIKKRELAEKAISLELEKTRYQITPPQKIDLSSSETNNRPEIDSVTLKAFIELEPFLSVVLDYNNER